MDSWSHEKRELPRCALCQIVRDRIGYAPPVDIVPERYCTADLTDLPLAVADVYLKLRDDQGMMIWGPAGTGKTYAMCAFARNMWHAGWEVQRIPYDVLMLQIRDTYKPGADQTEYEIIQDLVAVDKLIIEDVGTTVAAGAQESDFSLRTFLVILDQRLEHCRPTFVTSNKSIEEIRSSFDARIASRLTQACKVVQLKGKDRRAE